MIVKFPLICIYDDETEEFSITDREDDEGWTVDYDIIDTLDVLMNSYFREKEHDV